MRIQRRGRHIGQVISSNVALPKMELMDPPLLAPRLTRAPSLREIVKYASPRSERGFSEHHQEPKPRLTSSLHSSWSTTLELRIAY